MSSYFDALRTETAKIFGKDDFIERLIDLEEKVIKEVNLVTGDREFPEELREKIETLIATKRIKWIDGEINGEALNYAKAVSLSELLESLHSAFHKVASERIKTRFGILTDSPSGNLIMRQHHDDPTPNEGDTCLHCGEGKLELIEETPLKPGLAAFGCSAKLQCTHCDSTYIPRSR